MFHLYSERARRVIFLARAGAGARGAELIERDDLLVALLVEDQNKTSDTLSPHYRRLNIKLLAETDPPIGLGMHPPFLPTDAANALLESIRRLLPRFQPLPPSADMPISPTMGETLAAAIDLREKLQSKEVTPLHLLAALLAGSHQTVQTLRDAGITKEKVIDRIRNESH